MSPSRSSSCRTSPSPPTRPTFLPTPLRSSTCSRRCAPFLPPASTQVVNLLSPLRTFAEADHLHALWVKYRPEYEALVEKVHDPLTRTILNTNIYLKLPVS